MILEGANKLKEDSTYTIYAINSQTAGQYCVVVPNNINETLNMLIDLHQKNIYDEVASGAKTKDDLINTLIEIYTQTKTVYPNGMLIVPMFNETEYSNAVTNLDKQKMFDETKKIGAITRELYKKITDSGVEKQKIDQKIIIIEKSETDTKYINWLKEQMPGFVEGVSLKQEEKVAELTLNVSDIFGTPTEPTQVENNQTPPTTPVEEQNQTNDFFSNPTPVETPTVEQNIVIPTAPPITQTPTINPEPLQQQPENVDIFGIPTSQPAATPIQQAPTNEPVSPTPITPQTAPVQQESQPTPVETPIEAPKAVQDVALEGTTTFSAIPNTPQQPVENQEQAEQELPKKNGGFVNLAILLVVLVGVTIVSIELGKFLYSVYGA